MLVFVFETSVHTLSGRRRKTVVKKECIFLYLKACNAYLTILPLFKRYSCISTFVYILVMLYMQVNGGHQEISEGALSDYCDGKRFKQHSLFSTKPTALQLILYYDDVEICNPLGSCHKKYKIGKFD